ncbi:unnamed protein product [Rotaria sp. Silwood2]|nr:unnamed protein product [Rotaria sp. Silwood2]
MINTSNELEIFSTEIYLNLKILFIHCSDNIIFLDAYRWEKLILHYYPQLEIFYFIYYDRMNNDNQYSTYSYGLNQFSSSFWIQHRWIFNVQIDNTDIKYMVYPYRNNHYLHSLCFHETAANYQTIEYLQEINKYEQLLVDFTIKRINNNIYLQWK